MIKKQVNRRGAWLLAQYDYANSWWGIEEENKKLET